MSRPGTPAGCRARGRARPRLIDEFLPKIEEWVEASKGRIRADKAHEKLVALGYDRVGAVDPAGGRAGQAAATGWAMVRVHRPWVTEPGMWLQYDFGDGPVIDGVKTVLFVAWLAWSRFRVVIALRDRTLPTRVRRAGRDVPPAGWRTDVCADRQREDRDRSSMSPGCRCATSRP